MSIADQTLDQEQTMFLKHFGFSEVDVLLPLRGGMFSRPLLIRGDGRCYLIRNHSFRTTPNAFVFQAEVLDWAANHGVSCARVIPLLDGSWCRPLQDRSGVMALHEFIDGDTEGWEEWHVHKESDAEALPLLGRCVAHMHNTLRKAPTVGDPRLAIELPPIQFGRLHEAWTHWDSSLESLKRHLQQSVVSDVLLQVNERVNAHWQRLLNAVKPYVRLMPCQVVHGDISPVNLISRASGGWSFIDWDCVHHGWRTYDAIGDVLNRPPDKSPELNVFRPDHVSAYLAGYDSEANPPLTQEEWHLVPAFCLARQLEDLRQRVRALPNLSTSQEELYASLIQRRVEMMDQIELN